MTRTQHEILQLWHANRRGLGEALRTVGLTWEQLAEAELSIQLLAATLTWHYSTTACDPLTPPVAERLVGDLREHLSEQDWGGNIWLCLNGDHAVVLPEATPWFPKDCQATRSVFTLSDLRGMVADLNSSAGGR